MKLIKTLFFPCRDYCEDGGPRTHGGVEKTNSTDHHEWSYIISDKKWQTKMCNTRHIHSTLITIGQYLQKKKKGTGCL